MTMRYKFADPMTPPVVGSNGSRFNTRRGLYRNLGKRVVDIVLVLMGAPFVLPLVLVLAFLVALDGGNPFYLQDRVGKGLDRKNKCCEAPLSQGGREGGGEVLRDFNPLGKASRQKRAFGTGTDRPHSRKEAATFPAIGVAAECSVAGCNDLQAAPT